MSSNNWLPIHRGHAIQWPGEWVKFSGGRGNGRVDRVMLSVELTQYLHANAYTHADLYWDPTSQRLGLVFRHDVGRDSYVISFKYQKRAPNQVQASAMVTIPHAFLESHDLRDAVRGQRYKLVKDGNMYVAELNKPESR